MLSESLRNSGRAFKKKLVPVSRCINIYDGLGCCDIRIKKSVQKRLSEFTSVSLQMVNAKSTSMLTKIIALSDVYGLTFDIDQAELINDQRLIANIFKLIKKTQMILPSTSRSPRRRSLSIAMKNRRSKSPNKEQQKIIESPPKLKEQQKTINSASKPSLNLSLKQRLLSGDFDKNSNGGGLPSDSPTLNASESPFAFFLPQEFDFEFGSFNPAQLQQQFEQFMIQNPAAFEQMQHEMAELENYEDAQYDDDDDDEDEEEDDEEADIADDYDDDDAEDSKLEFSFGGGTESAFTMDASSYLANINPIEAWEAKHAMAAEHAYLQQQVYAEAIYKKQLQQDFAALSQQPPPEFLSDFGFGGGRGRGRGRGRGGYRPSRGRPKRSRRGGGSQIRRGKNIKHTLSVFATNRYAFLPSKEIKKANEKLMEIYYQAQWAALRLVAYQCLQWQRNTQVVQHNANNKQAPNIRLNLANIIKHNSEQSLLPTINDQKLGNEVEKRLMVSPQTKNRIGSTHENILESMIHMLHNCLNHVARCHERDRHIALRAANTWINRLLSLFITYSGDKLSDQQSRKLLSGLLYVVLNWDKFTFEVFQLSIKLTRKLITWTAADSLKIAQSDKQINPAQLMEMLMNLIGQIIHKKAPKATKYVAPQLSPHAMKRKVFKEPTPEIKTEDTEKKESVSQSVSVDDKEESDKNVEVQVEPVEAPQIEKESPSPNEKESQSQSQSSDQKEDNENKEEKEEKQEKSMEPVPSSPPNQKSAEKKKRRKSLTRSRVLSRYALKTKDSGDFCVVAQGNETVHKWKDVLCHREFEFLLPELTADDEEGAFLYLVVSEDSDTEYESEIDDKAEELAKSEALRIEKRRREKIEILAAKKRAEKRMKQKQSGDEPLFAKKKSSSKSKYDFFLSSGALSFPSF